MRKKFFAVAALSLALVPCVCFTACADKGNSTTTPPAGTNAAARLDSQITATSNTYTNIYGRAERKGGLFATSSQKSAVTAKYALADDTVPPEPINVTDTSALIEQLYETVKDGKTYNFQNKSALETYVIDVFAYTQIAQAIVKDEGKQALTKIYSVDYEVTSELYSKMTTGFWSTKIPEEMSFAGFDENSNKVNILFKAREPKNKENGVNLFEKVNSEMYYLSDDDFGYAQFTYRYDTSGNPAGVGFDYFSMKDKAMLEINTNPDGSINSTFLNGVTVNLTLDKRETVKTYFNTLKDAFNARTDEFEQQNLALAVEAGIEGIETETENEKKVYVKANAGTPYHVSFDYSVLEKMK